MSIKELIMNKIEDEEKCITRENDIITEKRDDNIINVTFDQSSYYKDKSIEDIEKMVIRSLAMEDIYKSCSRKIEVDTTWDEYYDSDFSIHSTIEIDGEEYACINITCEGYWSRTERYGFLNLRKKEVGDERCKIEYTFVPSKFIEIRREKKCLTGYCFKEK